jgi:hypothetical protein
MARKEAAERGVYVNSYLGDLPMELAHDVYKAQYFS